MQLREFGKTGLKVSQIGFGCGRVGGLLINGSRKDRERAFDAALAGGINWFDTAEAYGSEQALGELLALRKPDVNVSTKVTLDPRSQDITGDLVKQAQACMERLQRDHLTVLQVHNRIDDTGSENSLTSAQMLGPVLDGLLQMQRAGRTRFIGLTALGDTSSILTVLESGQFQSAQVYYNAINPSAHRAMPAGWSGQDFRGVMAAAKRHGMGMLGIRILDGGIIATDNREKPVSMMARQTSEEIEQQKTHKMLAMLQAKFPDAIRNRAQFGVRYALSCPDLSLGLVGIGAPDHVGQALEAEAMGPLPPAVLAAVEGMYPADFA
jgi:aryl-alcohol dehydrogenase-like predicted oxidoreductase